MEYGPIWRRWAQKRLSELLASWWTGSSASLWAVHAPTRGSPCNGQPGQTLRTIGVHTVAWMFWEAVAHQEVVSLGLSSVLRASFGVVHRCLRVLRCGLSVGRKLVRLLCWLLTTELLCNSGCKIPPRRMNHREGLPKHEEPRTRTAPKKSR